MWRDIVGLSFGALSERKLRSGLTILMVIIGATLITSIYGLNAGMQNFVNEQLSVLGANLLIVTPAPVLVGRGPSPSGGSGSSVILNEQTVKTLKGISGVDTVVPIYSGGVKIRASGRPR